MTAHDAEPLAQRFAVVLNRITTFEEIRNDIVDTAVGQTAAFAFFQNLYAPVDIG